MPEESLSAILEAESRTEETRSFIKQVRRITRRKFTPEEKIRIVLEGFRHEIALTRLQLAELLLEHYPEERTEALEHLDFTIGEFRDMKMQPSLERALRHKEILGA